MGFGTGDVRRFKAIFGTGQLVDRAVFYLGQLCRPAKPLHRPVEQTFW